MFSVAIFLYGLRIYSPQNPSYSASSTHTQQMHFVTSLTLWCSLTPLPCDATIASPYLLVIIAEILKLNTQARLLASHASPFLSYKLTFQEYYNRIFSAMLEIG